MRQLMNSGLLIAEGHGIWRAESDEIQWRKEKNKKKVGFLLTRINSFSIFALSFTKKD